jgi:nucleoside-diphosphate-sugar epimerase
MIFIIGGKGFVGSAFSRVCETQKMSYAIITKQNYPEFMGKQCDIVIDADGNSSKVLAINNPVQDFDINVRSLRTRLTELKYDCYVYLSSCDVYPDCSSPAATKEDQKISISRQNPYGFHKYLAELCVQQVSPKWLIFRPGGFVGPGLKKNAIFDILKGGPLWLDPESELQFIQTDQAAEIVLKIIAANRYNEIFNLCGQGLIRLREIIDHININVTVSPNSPRVKYDVSIEKLSKLIEIPMTRQAVFEFIKNESNLSQERKS